MGKIYMAEIEKAAENLKNKLIHEAIKDLCEEPKDTSLTPTDCKTKAKGYVNTFLARHLFYNLSIK
jgi:hypothetical protein